MSGLAPLSTVAEPRHSPARPLTRAQRPEQTALSAWVRLLRVHGLMLRELRRRVPEELTLPQFDVLVQLARRPEGMTPGELTRALLVTAGNVTGIVGRVVRGGLAERRPVPGDRRAVLIRLTGRGRRLMQRALPQHCRDVGALLARVSPGDLGRLRDLLGTVERGLERP
jgi:DNA-binding MarR family transcriptional regulator